MIGKKVLVYSSTFIIVGSALMGAILFLDFDHQDNHDEHVHHQHEHSHAHHHHGHDHHSHEHDLHNHEHAHEIAIAEHEEHSHHEDDHNHDEHAHHDHSCCHSHEHAEHDHAHETAHHHGHGHSHGHSHHHHHESSNVVKLDDDQIKKLNLEFFIAQPKELNIKFDAKGKMALRPDGLAHILSKTSGTAYDVKKNVGDWVQKDELIAIIESQSIAELKANYLSALNHERHMRLIHEREEKLFNKKISCSRECQAARADYEDAKIQTKLALQKLYSLGLNDQEIRGLLSEKENQLRLLAIRSPLDGIITERHFTKGEQMSEATEIFKIVDPRTLLIEISMYPKEAIAVKEGMPIKVSSTFGEQTSEGTLTYISPVMNDDQLSTSALAEINNVKGEWKPGMFVNVEIYTDKVQTPLAVPVEAIKTIEGKPCLFVHNDKGFEKRFVILGKTDGKNVEILKGIELGENCVSSNALLIKAEMGKNSIEHEH